MQQLAQSPGQQLQVGMFFFFIQIGSREIWDLSVYLWHLKAGFSTHTQPPCPSPRTAQYLGPTHHDRNATGNQRGWIHVSDTKKKNTGLTDSILHVTPQKFNGWNLKRSPWKRDSELGKHHFSGSMLKFRGSILVV